MEDLTHAKKCSVQPHPQPQPQRKRNYTDTLTSQKPLIYLIETFHRLSFGGTGPETERGDPTALENPQHV